MSISTALLCGCLAFRQLASLRGPSKLATILSIVAILLPTGILAAHVVAGQDAVSLFLQKTFCPTNFGSQTSVAAALSAAFLGYGGLRPHLKSSVFLASLTLFVSAVALLGYAYGVRDLYAMTLFKTTSIRTAFSFCGLSLAFLLTNKRAKVSPLLFSRTIIGGTTRRQLGFLIVPPIIAYLLLKATVSASVGPGAAMALLVALTIAPLTLLILRDARALTELENERQAKQESTLAKMAAEVRYHSLFDQLDEGFCIIEMIFDEAGVPVDYRFLEVNPAFLRQTGLDDAQGRRMRELAPDHEQHWFETYGRVAKTGVPVRFEHEATALNSFYEVYAFRIDEPSDQRVAILFNDVSARRRSELDLKALNETLEARVASRAFELEQAQDALRQAQKMEAIGQLTGGVAHDFNNLLTVIRGSVDLLKRPNVTPERRARSLNAIGETADRAAKLTSQLLAFARRQSLRPEVFDVTESLRESMTIVSTMAGSRITLKLEESPEPCFVLADRSQFDTAILNLSINARDAMNGEGRIVFSVASTKTLPDEVKRTSTRSGFVAISVADTGSGIKPGDMERIFEPFFTTKDVGSGTGLGLSQVFGFTRQSGGDVRVSSEPGQGATFTLFLPREYAQINFEPSVQSNVSKGDGVCVLVVEDNSHVGEFAVSSLQELGYRSVLAQNADQALRLLTEDRDQFDVVFSDVVMPGRSGLELGSELRDLFPELPIVLTSGYSHVLAKEGVLGFDFLQKPYSIAQLSLVLRKAVNGRGSGHASA